jgi:transposase-like protein
MIILCVRRYLRFCLSYRNMEELMAERNPHVDHVTIWRWVQRYAPEMNRRCRPELRNPNRSWRVDETYLRVAGTWTYLYRAVDSTGATLDFLLSARRDAYPAKRFLQKALRSPGHPRPRVINVDGSPSYPKVVSDLKLSGELGRRRRCRPVRFLNNGVEQDHRSLKRRVRPMRGFWAFHAAWRTIQGIETVNMIRKGQEISRTHFQLRNTSLETGMGGTRKDQKGRCQLRLAQARSNRGPAWMQDGLQTREAICEPERSAAL